MNIKNGVHGSWWWMNIKRVAGAAYELIQERFTFGAANGSI